MGYGPGLHGNRATYYSEGGRPKQLTKGQMAVPSEAARAPKGQGCPSRVSWAVTRKDQAAPGKPHLLGQQEARKTFLTFVTQVPKNDRLFHINALRKVQSPSF